MNESEIDFDKLSELAKYSGDPWKAQNPYFSRAEEFMDKLWISPIWPFIKGADFTNVVDLAAGHGRNTRKLLEFGGAVYVLDIQAGNIESCRQRFGAIQNIQYAVNNGFDMRPISDGWATFIYCFDAMVHFDSDVVRSYLRDTLRVLKPGGRAFFHHSNYTEGDSDWTKGKGSRNFMSERLFRHYAEKEGLRVVKQQVIDWAQHKELDCLSLIQRPNDTASE